jgi:FdhD protein
MHAEEPAIDAAIIARLPEQLRGGQAVFEETGGLHAAALFSVSGELRAVREDVGRHNAVDKVIGALFRSGALPASDALLVVSGRVAYEIVQKAAAAGIAVLVAVGAPSSLAIDASRAAGMTLIGFARDGRFNVYTGERRLRR